MIRPGWLLRVVAMFFLVGVLILCAFATAAAITHGLPAVRIVSPAIAFVIAAILLGLVIRAHAKAAPPPPDPNADTLRRRAGNIGCGAVAFALSGVFFVAAMGSVVTLQFSGATIATLVFGVLLCVVTLLFWLNAIRSVTDDDDLFSGTRGAAFAIIVVVFVAIAGAWIVMAVQADFWRGFLAVQVLL